VDEGEQVTRFAAFMAGLNLLIGKCSIIRGSERAVAPRHDEPKYRAFLSYSQADAGLARRVGARLERFRIDREFVGRPARGGCAPEALRPIFRSRNDLSPRRSPRDAASTALADSAALIILGSPNSLRSKYNKEEFRLFKSRHPERPVIVLIIEGTGDWTNSSFRPALRFVVAPDWAQSPADALPLDRCAGDGFELAIAKVVAWLTGLNAHDLYRRAERARRRRRRVGIAAASAMALLGTASGVCFWQSHQRNVAWGEVAALIDSYELASPTQAAAPGAKESMTRAITAIAKAPQWTRDTPRPWSFSRRATLPKPSNR
jgi:hypothetical protein